MDRFYVISSGSYSDYSINFIVKSSDDITEEQFRRYYLESIKRNSDFSDEQSDKLAKYLGDKSIKSTNYFIAGVNRSISYTEWYKLCNDAGVTKNPEDWFEKVLVESGCKIINYEEYNIDED